MKLRAIGHAVVTCVKKCAVGLVAAVPDIVGLAGLGLLWRGIELQYGQQWSMMTVGALLLIMAVFSMVRGRK